MSNTFHTEIQAMGATTLSGLFFRYSYSQENPFKSFMQSKGSFYEIITFLFFGGHSENGTINKL